MKELQLMMHSLKYTSESRELAAVQLQAWWRSILARRVTRIANVSKKMGEVYQRLYRSARRVQSNFRGRRARKEWQAEIDMAVAARFRRQITEMQYALGKIIILQRGFRSQRARKRIQALFKEHKDSEALLESKMQKDSLPETVGDSVRPDCSRLPHINHALHDLREDGVEPFYERSSFQSQRLRHCIGGLRALPMQHQFATMEQAHPGTCEESSSADDSLKVARDTSWKDVDKPRQVYLDGLSPGFLASLDTDVWPVDPWQRTKPKRSKKIATASPRRLLCQTKILGSGPSHAELRAQQRQMAFARQPPKMISVHALLAHASPPPPVMGQPSPAAWLRGDSALAPIVQEAASPVDECSWPSATHISPRRGKLRPLVA